MNSLYGSCLNDHFRLGRREIGASITYTGRQITTHMAQTIGYYLTGNTHTLMKGYIPEKNKAYKIYYNDGFAKFVQLNNLEMINKLPRVRSSETDAAVYWHVEHHPEGDRISTVTVAGDTDSVAGDSITQTNFGNLTFEELFNKCDSVITDNGKEYAIYNQNIQAMSFNKEKDMACLADVKMVYRHKVTKQKYTITLEDGNTVSVTSDHSLMVDRNNKLFEIKPVELKDDIFICLVEPTNGVARQKIKSIVIDSFEDEYVYDLVMEDTNSPYFFANNILVHNSNYFKTLAETDDEAVEIADEIGRLTNESFPGFMKEAFNCSGGNENLIKCAREIVGSSALFLHAKKKYTIKVINLDGKPVDKLKAMGSEIKKADTPKAIQNFLKGLMDIILNDGTYQQMEDFINKNRSSLIKDSSDLISLGTAKQLNNLDEKYAEYLSQEKLGLGKTNLPGHIRAAVNYNEMVKYFEADDKLLTAGDKGIIFYVRKNQFKIEAIAFPSDITAFPEWFNENFEIDKKITEEKMIDMKLEGIFEALGQKLPTPQTAFINKLFTF